MIVNTLPILVALAGVAAAAVYIPIRRKASKAYAAMYRAEGAAAKPAREAYWQLDRDQKTIAVVAMTAFAFNVLIALLVQIPHSAFKEGNPLAIWSYLATSASVVSIGLTAMFYNDRDADVRMKDEEERRSKKS
jgi:hypothetical protein